MNERYINQLTKREGNSKLEMRAVNSANFSMDQGQNEQPLQGNTAVLERAQRPTAAQTGLSTSEFSSLEGKVARWKKLGLLDEDAVKEIKSEIRDFIGENKVSSDDAVRLLSSLNKERRGADEGKSHHIEEDEFDIRLEQWKAHEGFTLKNPPSPEKLAELEAKARVSVPENAVIDTKAVTNYKIDGLTGKSLEEARIIVENEILPRIRVFSVSAGHEERAQDLLRKATSTEELREGMRDIFKDAVTERDTHKQDERGFRAYGSINEISIDIMKMMGGDYARGGKYALLEYKNGQEVFQPKNFLRWVRQQMLYYHNADPDNPEINLNRSVSIIGSFREITLQQIIDTRALFTDSNGKFLEGLRDQVLYEAWLFGSSRTNDAYYRQTMGSDDELPKILGQIYKSNSFTKNGTLERILTLMNLDADEEVDFEKRFANDPVEKGKQGTGQALRAALLSYYYLSDREMLERIEEDKQGTTALFNNKTFIDQYIAAKINGGGDEKREVLRKEAEKIIAPTKECFGADNKLIKEKKKLDKFMSEFNIFNSAQKDIRNIKETRERIKLMVMEKTGISYEEAEYAETFAFTMARWTGIGAKNDTGAVGFDAWTKVLDTERYREGQSMTRRGGLYGNPYSLPGFHRLGVDFFLGVKDEGGMTILEKIQGGQGNDVNLKNPLGDMVFGERTMAQFHANHISKSFELFHSIVETGEMNFDKFTVIDQYGRIVFDPTKANDVIDKTFKALRYAYSTWPQLDYSKKIRVRMRVPDGKGGFDNEFKEVSVAEMLWGNQLLESVKARFEKSKRQLQKENRAENAKKSEGDSLLHEDNLRVGDFIQQKGRNIIWKESLKYMIAAEMRAHSVYEPGFRKYTFAEQEKIYKYLNEISGHVVGDENNMMNTYIDQWFFTPQDINWIRKTSGTEFGKGLVTASAMSILGGIFSGVGKVFGGGK